MGAATRVCRVFLQQRFMAVFSDGGVLMSIIKILLFVRHSPITMTTKISFIYLNLTFKNFIGFKGKTLLNG